MPEPAMIQVTINMSDGSEQHITIDKTEATDALVDVIKVPGWSSIEIIIVNDAGTIRYEA